jgi:SAM-dependent methyltransferase
LASSALGIALGHAHASRRGAGTTLDRFRLNALVTQVAFGGRRRRVYRRIVALSGTKPGERVLDIGSSSGYLARMLAGAAGPSGAVTGIDPAEGAIAAARRRAPAFTPVTSAAVPPHRGSNRLGDLGPGRVATRAKSSGGGQGQGPNRAACRH